MTLPIKELRAKAEVATPGPWEHFRDPDYERDAVVRDSDENELLELGLSENMEADAAFIAATNPATVLALLDRIVTLTALAGEACGLAMSFDVHGPQPGERKRIAAIRHELEQLK